MSLPDRAEQFQHIERVAREVLAYLRAHPQACDTARGVCQWWIPRQRLQEAEVDVEAALELLRQRGNLELRIGSDGSRLYCLPAGALNA